VERRATGTAGREVEILARDAADDLLDRLAASPALYDLTINPLLLTMIANVHRFRSSLPSSRADLYGEVCQVMLWRRQEAKRLELPIPGASKERLLAWLAFDMMRSGTRDIDRRVLLDGIRPRLKRVSGEITPEDFVNDVGSNGLLVERERDLYAFAHLTFQEFLAARYIQEHRLEQVLIDAVDDPWWRETTLLYLAGADADPIVEAALKSGTPTALSLGFECEEMGAELAPELRQRLAEVMRNAFAPDAAPESRRLAAGVLANQNLRNLVLTPTGTRVCPDPVSTELYWLFQTDARMPSPDGNPRTSHEPARGMWSRDAVAFVRWINGMNSMNSNRAHQSAGILYRLPSPDELDALLLAGGSAAQILRSRAKRVWSIPTGGGMPTVWETPDQEPANVVPAEALLTAMVADLHESQVMNRLMTVTAGEMAARLAPDAASVLEAAQELARGTLEARSGRDSGGLVNSDTMNVLRRQLKSMRGAATLLEKALNNLPVMSMDTAGRIDLILGQLPVDRAIELLVEASSFGRDIAIVQEWNRDLGVETVLPDARAIRERVQHSRIRLRHITDPEFIAGSTPSLLATTLGLDGDEATFARDTEAASQNPAALGVSLGRAVTAALKAERPEQADNRRDVTTLVAGALIHLSTAGVPAPTEVDLGRVAQVVRQLANTSVRRFSAPVWAHAVLGGLQETAAPVFGRQRPLTADAATAIRVPAIVLAAEAATAGEPALAADLFRLAAATLLMRRRAEGTETLEGLVLAIT
ncbi:MAG TPA: hypothetical protein VGB74_09640, partial [Actinoplanes sp.]